MSGVLLIALLAGCAAVEPNAVRIEAVHESHLLQHLPGNSYTGNYGENRIDLTGVWRPAPHVVIQASEGYEVQGSDYYPCPHCDRDIFTLRFGYEIPLKP